ncbi:MAG TPA: hypothetical protein PLR04_03000 [Bacilli bacterium]|nr:hypothetical protein [Bacilli bacterium]
MTNAFLSLLLALLSLQLFAITMRLNTINRIVISTPISLLEISIPLVNEQNEEPLYFDQELLKDNFYRYYENTLSKYTSQISLEFYYYNQLDHSYCLGDKCDAVEVKITARVIFNFDYHRTMFYEIKDTNYGH